MSTLIASDPRDLEMVKSPLNWPWYPILPLKHKSIQDEHGGRKMGCLIAWEGPKVRLCLTVFLVTDFSALQFTQYESWEALLEEWTVD